MQFDKQNELLQMKEVKARTKLSRSTIYGKLNKKSNQYDPDFPAPIPLGPKSRAWVDNEIDSWIAKKIEKRNETKKHEF